MGGYLKEIGNRIYTDLKNYRTVILIFAVYYVFVHVVFRAFCPLVMLTGFPCAGCGMTRAVFFMLTGQPVRSWMLNPMALPVVLFAVYCAFTRYFLGKRVKGFKCGVIILLIGLLAAYIYRMCTVFPDRPPYVYTSGSFFEKMIPYYREGLHQLLGI